MTDSEAASSLEVGGLYHPTQARVVACGFCLKRLADGYFFTCLRCDASYCYIHMSRHQPLVCAVQSAKRRRLDAAPVRLPVPGVRVLLARSKSGGPVSSANV